MFMMRKQHFNKVKERKKENKQTKKKEKKEKKFSHLLLSDQPFKRLDWKAYFGNVKFAHLFDMFKHCIGKSCAALNTV